MTTTTTFVARRHRIDDHCEILAGLRMEITNASVSRYGFHKSPELKARARKLKWATTDHNPEGRQRWAADLDISQNGDITIPADAFEPYYQKKDPKDAAHLMLNIVCRMPRGNQYFATIGFFGKPELYSFDAVEPQDESGRFVYSRPIHLDVVGKRNFFFFMTIEGTPSGNAELKIYKLTVARGNRHYHLSQEQHFPARDSQKRGVMGVGTLKQLAATDRLLRDLPIGKLIDAWEEWRRS